MRYKRAYIHIDALENRASINQHHYGSRGRYKDSDLTLHVCVQRGLK